MSNRPHTVGEVVSEVVRICTPSDSSDVRAGRSHDGLRIALSSRAMDDMRDHPLTPQVRDMIQGIVASRQGLREINVPDAIAFISNANVHVPEPGRLSKTVSAVSSVVGATTLKILAMIPSRKSANATAGVESVTERRDDDGNGPDAQTEAAFEPA